MKIIINKETKEATIELTHNRHEEYIDERVPNEVKEYIQDNLRRTPRQLSKGLEYDYPYIKHQYETNLHQIHYGTQELQQEVF